MMNDTRIKSIAILGGGTAGWMTAAALIKRFQHSNIDITLVESAEIGTIGVGEATVPFIKEYLKLLEINEIEFIQKTNATFKLGIEFDGWKNANHSFMHPFAGYGAKIDGLGFHHFWFKMKSLQKAGELDSYCLASQIAKANKFAIPTYNQDAELSSFNYAFHFDAGLFAQYLSEYAINRGVKRIDAKVQQAHQDPDSGFITALTLNTQQIIHADFFIDCSGFKGLLIEDRLKTGYEEWKQWLPCDSAIALPCESNGNPASFTRSLACEAGWQWRIPLQHRTGNGHVFSSRYISDEKALQQLIENLDGKATASPKLMKFTTGMRKQSWNKNVYAIGLSSGFLEPLESTSIYMIHESINLLIDNFPNKFYNPSLIAESNRVLRTRQERLRDFIILHYHLNQRIGQPFWDDCRHMQIPASLEEKIALFKDTAQISLDNLDFFRTNSWIAMFAGFDVMPNYYHPMVDNFDEAMLEQELNNISASIETAVKTLPSHSAFIQHNCAASAQAE